jgi:uroporphyrinogen decarboxylase
MSNRSELMDAITRRRPARIPYTFDAREETVVGLRRYLGLDDGADVGAHFGCNAFASLWSALGAGPSMPERQARQQSGDPERRIDIWGVQHKRQHAGEAIYWEIDISPLARAETVAEIESYDWPRPEEVIFPEIPAGLDLAAWKADRVVLDMSYICPFGVPWMLRGLEQTMMDMALNPEITEAIVAQVEQFTLGCLEIVLTKYPGMVDLIGCGDDYGSQQGLLMSPEMIATHFMPSLGRHYEMGRRHGARGYHHSCGAIFAMIPLLIDAGLDVLNPIQTSAAGMDPVRIKQAFGNDLCFHGAIDTQQTLAHGTPDAVRAEVRARVEQLGPEGFILAPSHVLQPNVAPENIVALYEEIRSIEV